MQRTYSNNNYNPQSQWLRESSQTGTRARVNDARISTNDRWPATMNGYTPATMNGHTPATMNGYTNWQSMLKLKVTNLSSVTRAKDLKDHFEAFGKLERVELDRDVPGTAYIVYRPVPLNESFLSRPHIRDGHQIFITPMPHSPDRDPDRWGRWGRVGNRSKYTFRAISLDLGVMLGPDTFVPEWRTCTSVELSLNFEAKTIHIHFVHNNRRYKMETNFKHIDDKVLVAEEEPNIYTLTLPLKYPGRYWWFNPEARFETDMEWYQKPQWHRVVNIPLNDDVPNRIDAPLTPHLADKVVRIGRWTIHRLRFQCASTLERERFTQILHEVAEYNILAYNHAAREFVQTPLHTVYPANLPLVIDPASQLHREEDFEILYMLESLILNNIINERNLDLPFYQLLTSITTSCAVHALVSLAAPKRRIYNPFEQLKAKIDTITIAPGFVPPNCLMVRKVIITPTTLYVAAPVMETSNRVVRNYSHVQDRFLRVQFLDEGMGKVGLTAASESRVNDTVYDRIYDVQRKGIKIGNRVYKFLAFSNSQLREHACWFFAPESSLSCYHIRKWMGNFSSIKVVAKNAARMGQCFSSTRAISKLEVQDVVTINDIENHGYIFSDGIGKISPRLAKDVAEKLDLKSVPSAFQFRLGGAKGVLAVWNNVQGQVQLRPSQKKFESTHRELEIIKTSARTSAYLNRQVITLLSARGVPDQTFLDMKSQRICELDRMLKSPQAAIDTLMQNIDGYGTARFMADIVRAGFFVREDPFILNLIRLFRVTMLKDLKKRAKIHIPKGAYLLGVLDETRTLKENEVFVQISDPANPEKVKCIEGECVVLRVPCFHPGDVRVVQAVKCDRLRHLKDVLVFSANGDRDLPNMCSGGDLDGDEYTVIWDPNLLPPMRNYEAMSFKSSYKPGEVDKVGIPDIKKFFVNYILGDNLGMIANAHLAHADKSPEGAKDGRCLKLAQLHSIAVDFPKTGNPAIFKSDLRATEFPDFMGKKDKPMYESKKVLGIIYRSIQASDYKEYQSTLTDNLRFDSRLIVTGFQQYVTDARLQKRDYDRGIQSLQNQYGVRTESEIVSGFIMKYLKSGNKRKFELHKQAMDASNHFRHQFLRRFDQEFCREGSTAPTPEARRDREVKASAWYYVTYHPLEIARARNRGDGPHRFSFPWLVWELLCEIAKRNEKSAKAVTDAQVAALPAVVAQYEAENGLSESDDDDDDDESEYDVPSIFFSMTKSGLAVASGTSFGPAQHVYVDEFAQRNLVGIRAAGVVPEGDLLGLNDAF